MVIRFQLLLELATSEIKTAQEEQLNLLIATKVIINKLNLLPPTIALLFTQITEAKTIGIIILLQHNRHCWQEDGQSNKDKRFLMKDLD